MIVRCESATVTILNMLCTEKVERYEEATEFQETSFKADTSVMYA